MIHFPRLEPPQKSFFAWLTFLLATSVISMSTALHYKIHVESLKEKWHQIIYHELSRSEPVSPGQCQFPISRLRSPQIGVKSFDSTNNGCCVDVLILEFRVELIQPATDDDSDDF